MKEASKPKTQPTVRYVRIVAHGRKPGDTFEGFQAEIVFMAGDKVIKRQLIGKPDLFENAYSAAADMIDPRNESYPDDGT